MWITLGIKQRRMKKITEIPTNLMKKVIHITMLITCGQLWINPIRKVKSPSFQQFFKIFLIHYSQIEFT